jgi:endonuclease YncB( thermonuclease family)
MLQINTHAIISARQQLLQSCDAKPFSWDGICVVGKCVEAYDGDTIKIVVLHAATPVKITLRLAGINTPEIKLSPGPAYAARNRLLQYITNVEIADDATTHGKALKERLHGNTRLLTACLGPFDKYGRVLATVYPDEQQVPATCPSANHVLVSEGHAVAYDGRSTNTHASSPALEFGVTRRPVFDLVAARVLCPETEDAKGTCAEYRTQVCATCVIL